MHISRIAGAFAAALAVTLVAPLAAWAAEPPSVLGIGSRAGIVDRASQPDNEVWFAAQDPKSREKLFISYNTTPALGSPVPAMAIVGVGPAGDTALLARTAGSTAHPGPAGVQVSDNPPSISSPEGSVVYDPARGAYHITLNLSIGVFADLWFSGPSAA